MIVTREGGESESDRRREVTRVVVRDDGGEGAPNDRHMEFRIPGSLSRADILATLTEQGISGAQAEAIADKLEAKRRQSLRVAMAPLPPMPPIPPMPPEAAWIAKDGKAMAFAHCADGGNAMPIVDREDRECYQRRRVLLFRCHRTTDFSGQLQPLTTARAPFDCRMPAARQLAALQPTSTATQCRA